jgi:hypothetical protein
MIHKDIDLFLDIQSSRSKAHNKIKFLQMNQNIVLHMIILTDHLYEISFNAFTNKPEETMK